MARARAKAPKRRFDWVYRGREYLADGSAEPLSFESYSMREHNIVTGLTTATGLVLYDSQNYQYNQRGFDTASGQFRQMPLAGRAEGRKALVARVEGELFSRPSAWAVGSAIWWGWRIIVCDQDPDLGLPLLDQNWTMFNPTVVLPQTDVTRWANESRVLAEGYHFRLFNSNSSSWTLRPSWRGRRALRAEEGLFLWVEAFQAAGYANWIVRPRMRSLISDEG